MYKDISKNIDDFNLKLPKTHIPTPTNEDYILGFIYRYFIQKANDENSFVFEVSESIYSTYEPNPFWNKLRLKWRISGPSGPIYKNEKLEDRGVINSNKSSLGLASSQIKNISLYLPNLLQFYKG